MVTTMLTMMTSGTAPDGGLFASGGSAVSDMSQVHPRDLLDRATLSTHSFTRYKTTGDHSHVSYIVRGRP
jgi:hypothetical protein